MFGISNTASTGRLFLRAASRTAASLGPVYTQNVFVLSALAYDWIHFTPTEFNLIRTLAEAPGQVFSRPQLIEKAFGYDFEGFERNVDVHVTSLRRKLEAGGQRFIKTVYGLGYKLEAPAHASSRA